MLIDSGAGGLSIAKTLLDSAPTSLRLSYFADKSAFPYGNKDEGFLIQHVSALVSEFIEQHHPDLIVIACNTASTIVLPELRSRFSCPFVGVVPAIKPAASMSESKAIGVLATPATVNREYTAALIQEFAPDCKVALYGSDALVRSAENFVTGSVLDNTVVREELEKLLGQIADIDTIVLACTHFPLIAEALKQAAPQIRHWVDSSAAIARRTFDLLSRQIDAGTGNVTEHELDVLVSKTNEDETGIDELKQRYLRFLMAAGS